MPKKFGIFSIKDDLSFQIKDHSIHLEKIGSNSYLYQRKKDDQIISERTIFFQSPEEELAIYPTRPISQPQPLSHHILIKIDPPIVIPPRTNVTHNLLMPIEIGVFTTHGVTNNHLIDSFSLSNPKYALYGLPETGYICRYYKSNSRLNTKAEKYLEALIIMKFENSLDEWASVQKIVMDAYMVDFYLKEDDVYLEDSNMVIENGNIASVYLNNKPPIPNLEEIPMANEEVKKFRLTILDRAGFGVAARFIMENGF